MLPVHIAARELDRRRAERSAEIARQLPLYAEDPAYLEPPADGADAPRREPDWASDY
ncbi:hypothetical protein [Azospirillum halopraeferens]|uniref:hypothetical protein n=1 Tax=Azospirillum halopraeferens TaxID=34010 RepID=UPI00041510D8|nr:hypothetical protein [Azospirillum halopraeferens]